MVNNSYIFHRMTCPDNQNWLLSGLHPITILVRLLYATIQPHPFDGESKMTEERDFTFNTSYVILSHTQTSYRHSDTYWEHPSSLRRLSSNGWAKLAHPSEIHSRRRALVGRSGTGKPPYPLNTWQRIRRFSSGSWYSWTWWLCSAVPYITAINRHEYTRKTHQGHQSWLPVGGRGQSGGYKQPKSKSMVPFTMYFKPSRVSCICNDVVTEERRMGWVPQHALLPWRRSTWLEREGFVLSKWSREAWTTTVWCCV